LSFAIHEYDLCEFLKLFANIRRHMLCSQTSIFGNKREDDFPFIILLPDDNSKKVRNSGRVLTNYNPSYLSGIRLPKTRHSIKLSDETNLFFFSVVSHH
jgi:hypothetical protein